MTLGVADISKNLFDLSGYCSIVTGAGQGIGFAFAQGLANSGSAVVLVDMNSDQLEKAAQSLKAGGAKVATVQTDVTADNAPDKIVKAALDLGGRIDVLINNAGILSFTDAVTIADAEWDKMYNINLRAPMRIMRAVLAEMAKRERGSVINMGSSWSSRGSVFNQDGGGIDYCSSKSALQSLSRSAAQDVASKGIRVNCIAPGVVDTPMHAGRRQALLHYEQYIPLGRLQVAEDLVGTALFLASDASMYMTGQTLHVNGGMLMVD